MLFQITNKLTEIYQLNFGIILNYSGTLVFNTTTTLLRNYIFLITKCHLTFNIVNKKLINRIWKSCQIFKNFTLTKRSLMSTKFFNIIISIINRHTTLVTLNVRHLKTKFFCNQITFQTISDTTHLFTLFQTIWVT